jgi:phosphoribosylformylglycinamidine synthase
MKFTASIDIMPIKEILDPQGKAVLLGLKNLDIHAVEDCRIGRHIHLTLEADSAEQAEELVEKACKQLLANLIMEEYSFKVIPA